MLAGRWPCRAAFGSNCPTSMGGFKAIGLVEGYPVYERTSKDGGGAMIGLDTNECLDSSSCLLYVCCV